MTEGSDGFEAVLAAFIKNGRNTDRLPHVNLGGSDYGRVHYLLSPSDSEIISKVKNGDKVLLEQILYVRKFGFGNVSVNPGGYSLNPQDYSDEYISKKAALFRSAIYENSWYNWGGVFGYDAHFIDVDADVDVGNFMQHMVYFGSQKGADHEDGTYQADYMFGNGGNDVLEGDGGEDYIEGNAGDDTLFGGEGADTIHGGEGDDRIVGGSVFLNDDQEYGDMLYGDGGNDYIEGGAGDDYLEGGKGEDTLRGGADSDVLLGGTETDYLYGDSGNDTLLGGDDTSTDVLFGGSGEDTLLAQGGDDVLAGGESWDNLYGEKEHDYLLGGSGYDLYYVSNSDTINDADYAGLIMFNDKSLSGKKRKVEGSDNLYEDDYFVYAPNGNDMVVVEKATQEYITIENFNFHSVGFGINFSESDPNKQDIELKVSDATTTEGGDLVFNVSINHALKYDLTVDVASYFNSTASTKDVTGELNGTVTIAAGAVSAEFTITTKDDEKEEPTEKFLFAATGYKYAGENKQDNDLGSLLIMNGAEGTILDNETKTPLEVSVSDASLDEANAMMRFTVSLDGVLEDGEELTVDFQTADNTATASYDYASTTKSVTFTKDSLQLIQTSKYNNWKDYVEGGLGSDTIYNYSDKIKSKNTTQKPLNNICTPNILIFVKKQDTMTDCFKRVA